MNSLTETIPPRLVLAAETAADLMAANPVSIVEHAGIADAIAVLADKNLDATPVIDDAGRPLGVLTQGDILVHQRQDRLGASGRRPAAGVAPQSSEETLVRDVMTPAVFSVAPETSAARVVEQLLALNVNQLFVVDSSEALVGVISIRDVIRSLRAR